jgi:hypothetical protein
VTLLPLLKDILLKALNLLNAPDGSLMLLDDETNELVFVLAYGSLGENLINYRIPPMRASRVGLFKIVRRRWCEMSAAMIAFPI